MSNATAKLFLDKRGSENGEGVVKILITHKRKQRLRTTGLKISEADWSKLQRSVDENGISQKIKSEYLINVYEFLYRDDKSDFARAKSIIENLGSKFSFDKFFYIYDNNIDFESKEEESVTDLLIALQNRQTELLENEQISLAGILHCIVISMQRFLKSLTRNERIAFSLSTDIENTELPFDKICPKLLVKYEKWMLMHGRISRKKGAPTTSPASLTTVSIYLRNVRTIYKEAIANKVVSQDDYPFSQNGYTIPNESGKKKALDKANIQKILSYEVEEGSQEEQAKFLWVFSYLSNGMNISDICRLKYSDIEGDNINFVRKKTSRANRGKKKIITTTLFPVIKDIIQKIGNKNKEGYVFPFLNETNSELERKKKIALVINLTNEYMNRIGKKLGIEINLTTYVARHSFATILARSNVPTLFISQSLGHSSIKTTENYLGAFEKEQTEDFLKNLL